MTVIPARAGMAKWIAGTALLLLAVAAQAQVAAPDTWRKESFRFPLQFAPSIPFEGSEHVRFAPDWTDFASERGFTYVILWDIKRRSLEPQEIERALNVYFDGLMEAVTKARRIDDPGTVSSASLHPIAPVAGWAAGYGGRVWTWNGFSKAEPLVLHLEVTLRPCEPDRTQLLFALSKAARAHAAWDELRAIRSATRC